MAYTPTKKMKGVGYFHHFPKNFLKPYGRSEPYPSHNVALSRLRPEGCEWLRRPHVATSELSSTVNDNMPVLTQDDQLLDPEKIQKLKRNLEPLALLLQQFHKATTTAPNDTQRRNLLLQIVNPSQDLSKQLDACVEVGAALFSIGINLKVAQTLITNPESYADLLTFAPNTEPKFKSTRNILDLLPLLFNPKATQTTPTQSNLSSLISILQTASPSAPQPAPSPSQASSSTTTQSLSHIITALSPTPTQAPLPAINIPTPPTAQSSCPSHDSPLPQFPPQLNQLQMAQLLQTYANYLQPPPTTSPSLLSTTVSHSSVPQNQPATPTPNSTSTVQSNATNEKKKKRRKRPMRIEDDEETHHQSEAEMKKEKKKKIKTLK